VTFGFVARCGDSAGLRGARFQAVSGGSRSAGIGWNLWGFLPQLLPQAGRQATGAPASERNRLVENAVTYIRRQAGLGDDIYIDPKALLQVIGQRNQVEQAATFRHIDQKVEIAGSTLFAAADRAEHAHIASPVSGSDTEYVLPNRR
jgi:hypothetical protein